MVELFAEERKKELDELQTRLNWENIKLSSLIDNDKREKLTQWKKRIELIRSTLSIDKVIGQYISTRNFIRLARVAVFHIHIRNGTAAGVAVTYPKPGEQRNMLRIK